MPTATPMTVSIALFVMYMLGFTSVTWFMAMLRKKLQAGNDAQPFIQTHIGIGYRMLKAEKGAEEAP